MADDTSFDETKMPQPTSPQQQQHHEYLNHLRTSLTESSILLDKLIVILAAGGIGISLTLIDNIAAAVSKASVWVLVAAWMFLGLSLFIVLISRWLSIEAHRKAISYAQEKADGQDITTPSPHPADRNTGIVNIATILSLGIGLLFLFLFFSGCLYDVAPTTHHVHYVDDPVKYGRQGH